MWTNGNRAGPAVREVRQHRRRRDGQVPPARRPGDLRHARPAWRSRSRCATRSSTARATSARSTTTRRPRCATPRRGSRGSPRRCCASSTPTRSTSGRTTTSRSASRSCCRRGSRTCSSTARPGSPSGWRRTCRRTTSARRSTRSSTLIDKPDANVEDLMQHVKGPDFPTGAIIVGRSGIRDAYRTGRGRDRHARARPHRGAARRQERDHRHRAARTA